MLNNPAARKVASVVIDPPARLLIRLHVSPDVVTLVGTAGASVSAIVCFSTGRFVLGVVLITVFAISDLLDGTMARMQGTSGPWGNFLDATLDRVADGAIFGSLVVWGALNDQIWVVAGGLLALVTGQVTSYAKARAEAVGATANVGIAERAERLRIDRDVWRNESIKKQAACEQMGVRVGALEAERDKLRKEVREAFCEGFYEGKDGGWVVGPEGTPWKESHACAALKGINDD
jgi:CDP-diacylglycerol--glycerol-3-phosphate 3-phosphatidyltransferase